MDTLQGCIWEYEAAFLQTQSEEWDGPSSVLGSAIPVSLPVPLHSPVQGLEAVCWWKGRGSYVDCLSRVCLGRPAPDRKNSALTGQFTLPKLS